MISNQRWMYFLYFFFLNQCLRSLHDITQLVITACVCLISSLLFKNLDTGPWSMCCPEIQVSVSVLRLSLVQHAMYMPHLQVRNWPTHVKWGSPEKEKTTVDAAETKCCTNRTLEWHKLKLVDKAWATKGSKGCYPVRNTTSASE